MAQWIKNRPADAGDMDSICGSGRSPGVGKWQTTQVSLPGESHEQRSLAGYSPGGGHKRVGHDLMTRTVTCITESLCWTPETITTFKSTICEHPCVLVCMFYRLCVSEREDRSKEEKRGKQRHSHVSINSREESRTSREG